MKKNYISELNKKENNTGNIADAVEEITGFRGWMSSDMKPIYKARIVGRASTIKMRPVLNNDKRKYSNYALEIIDSANSGDILVYVMEDSLEVAAMGDLMGTAAKVRGITGAIIDGAVRDIAQLEHLEFPVWSRRVSPATMVGRMVSVEMQVPLICAGVLVKPGDYLVCDTDGVVNIPQESIELVLDKLKEYSIKEKKLITLIKKEKGIIKAIEKINRY